MTKPVMNPRNAFLMALVATLALASGGCFGPSSNRVPIAAFDAIPAAGYAPLAVRFDAGASADPDGDSLTFEWAFGDGATAAGRTLEHVYQDAGRYDVTLRVVDPSGAQAVASTTIDVLDIPTGMVVVRFDWTWRAHDAALDILVPWNLYLMYRGRIRSPFVDNYDYPAYVDDPLDDPTLADIADDLWALAGGDEAAFVECVLAMIQTGIDYRVDPAGSEWPLYPLETLIDSVGDCEDVAILLVSLLRARGIPCQLAFVDTDGDGSPDHVLTLVPADLDYEPGACGFGSPVFELPEGRYTVAEAAVAVGNLPVGCDPWDLDEQDMIQRWAF